MLAFRRFAQLRASSVSRQQQHAFSLFFRGLATLDDAIQLPMPALSPTMTHGGVVQWMLKEGDKIEPGSVMCEIETDKATVDYEAQDDGYLAKIIVQAGATDVPVGTVIGLVVEEEEMVEPVRQMKWVEPKDTSQQPAPAAEAPAPASTTTTTASHSTTTEHDDDKVRVSPAARHLLRLFAVPFSQVHGTGKAGMITKGDALKAVKGRELPATTLPPWAATPAPAVLVSAETPTAATVVTAATPTAGKSASVPTSGATFEDTAATGIRKVIATRLTQSKTQVPHFYSSTSCNIDRVLNWRAEIKSQLGVTPSVNDIIIKAVALALRDVPAMNSRYEENGVSGMCIANESIDVSVAVATPAGLITPIIFNADSKGLLGITADMRDLAGRARIGKLKPEEYQGGCFSVSNLGMFGIDSFSAVINPPQAGILAIGAGLPVARMAPASGVDGQEEEEIVFDTMMNVTLSCDRRVVDESDAAKFMECFRTYMENPMYLSV